MRYTLSYSTGRAQKDQEGSVATKELWYYPYNIAEVKIYCFCMCMQGMKGAAGKPGVKGFKGVAVSCCNECVYIYTHLAKRVTFIV